MIHDDSWWFMIINPSSVPLKTNPSRPGLNPFQIIQQQNASSQDEPDLHRWRLGSWWSGQPSDLGNTRGERSRSVSERLGAWWVSDPRFGVVVGPGWWNLRGWIEWIEMEIGDLLQKEIHFGGWWNQSKPVHQSSINSPYTTRKIHKYI